MIKGPELLRELERGELLPLYYFYGPEKGLMEQALARIKDRGLVAATRDFNFALFHAEEAEPEEVVAALQLLPLRSSRRVVVIRQADVTWQKHAAAYLEYFCDPNPSSCAVFIGEKADLRTKYFQALEKKGAAVVFYPLYAGELARWAKLEAEKLNFALSPDGLAALLERAGENLQELKLELEKLSLAHQGKRIGVEEVLALTGDTRTENPFDLARAAGRLEGRRMLRLLRKNLQQGESPVLLLSLIARELRLIWRAKELRARGLPRREVEAKLRILRGKEKEFWEEAERFPARVLPRIWQLTLQADEDLKSSRADRELLLERYLWEVYLCAKEKRSI